MQLTKKFWSSADFGGIHLTFERLKNFFREDTSEIIGAYFDGEKIFIARLTEKIETIELDADGAELEQLAEKISLACTQRAWKISSVGLCLHEGEVVTYQTEVAKIPEKEIPSLVKSWSTAQPGNDKTFSFARVGEEIWMETLPRARVEEFAAAFKKFNLNLRGLSLMPTGLLDKISPFDRAKFIAEVVRDKKKPEPLIGAGQRVELEKNFFGDGGNFLYRDDFRLGKSFFRLSHGFGKTRRGENFNRRTARRPCLERNTRRKHFRTSTIKQNRRATFGQRKF